MIGLAELIGGAVFLAFLASGDKDAVPPPKSKWNDCVGERIDGSVKKCLNHYNSALKSCNDALSRVKLEAQQKSLEVNFSSKHNDLDWQGRQIDAVNIDHISNSVNQILKG